MTYPAIQRVIQHLRRATQPRRDMLPDGALVETFIERHDDAAFEALVERHGPMVLGVCKRVLHHEQDAEDAFQATFLVFIRKAASIQPPAMVGNWLYGVAYRTALKARTSASKKRTSPLQETPARTSAALWDDLRPVLDRELTRMPDKYRVPIVLCDLEGKTQKEAAKQLCWPIGTVSGRLARARALLARRLTRCGVVVSVATLTTVLCEHAAATPVPSALFQAIVRIPSCSQVGTPLGAGLVSAKIAALMEGVMKSMWVAKVKVQALVLLSTLVVATTVGVSSVQLFAAAGDDVVEDRADRPVVAVQNQPPMAPMQRMPNFYSFCLTSMGPIFGPWLLLSALGIAYVAGRLAYDLRRERTMPTHLREEAAGVCRDGPAALVKLSRTEPSLLGQALLAGAEAVNGGRAEARFAAKMKIDAFKESKTQLLSLVAMLGLLAPLVELVGTIFGTIRTLQVLAIPGDVHNSYELAEGISHALVATFLGVLLTIVAVIVYFLFKNRLNYIATTTGTIADRVLAQLPPTGEGR